MNRDCLCSDVQATLSSVRDRFFFLVLGVGRAATEDIPVGVRALLDLLQAAAARVAHFDSVSVSALAPADK